MYLFFNLLEIKKINGNKINFNIISFDIPVNEGSNFFKTRNSIRKNK